MKICFNRTLHFYTFSAKRAHHVRIQGGTDNIVKFSCLLCLPKKNISAFANYISLVGNYDNVLLEHYVKYQIRKQQFDILIFGTGRCNSISLGWRKRLSRHFGLNKPAQVCWGNASHALIHSLYVIRHSTGSQFSCFNTGVICSCNGVRDTNTRGATAVLVRHKPQWHRHDRRESAVVPSLIAVAPRKIV